MQNLLMVGIGAAGRAAVKAGEMTYTGHGANTCDAIGQAIERAAIGKYCRHVFAVSRTSRVKKCMRCSGTTKESFTSL